MDANVVFFINGTRADSFGISRFRDANFDLKDRLFRNNTELLLVEWGNRVRSNRTDQVLGNLEVGRVLVGFDIK
jgi:hypothetical protein